MRSSTAIPASSSGSQEEVEESDEEFCLDDADFQFEDEDESAAVSYAKRNAQSAQSPTHLAVVDFRVYPPEEIKDKMDEHISDCCDALGLENETVEALLRFYRWKQDLLMADWLNDSQKVFKQTGIPNPEDTAGDTPCTAPTCAADNTFFCPIMADEFDISETDTLRCGHRFSIDCWRSYLQSALSEGDNDALAKRCPQYKCEELIPMKFWKEYLSKDDFQRFNEFRMRTYVTLNPLFSWCPAPDCPNAVELFNSTKADVQCTCGQKFCFFCGEEQHRPIPCEIIRQWNEKNSNEADNVTWILVHTKNCPRCKQPIEKNQGCMHMTCRCGGEFCWLCLVDWKKHNSSSLYRCNIYEGEQKTSKTEQEKARAKESLERYAHYFERYRAHNSAQRSAVGDLMKRIKIQMDFLHNLVGELTDVDFLQEAVLQIVECRRILKFSYAYGYFADWSTNPGAKDLFEYHQGQLEKTLDSLHEMTEKFSADEYIGENVESYGPVFEFKSRLVNLTRVVKEFFKKMSDAFETDFIKLD